MFRDEICWISNSGQLLRVLPVVGKGPHGFFSVFLQNPRKPKSSSDHSRSAQVLEDKKITKCDDDGSGLYVFFNDGMGGISCLRPYNS